MFCYKQHNIYVTGYSSCVPVNVSCVGVLVIVESPADTVDLLHAVKYFGAATDFDDMGENSAGVRTVSG